MIPHPQDFFLSCKECVLENPRNFYGCFSLGPFQNSQSLTVANALRRTLLSELRGIAITHVEINGVVHEYSTLPGVRESILDILLNFKQIVLKKVSPFSKTLYGYLNVRGPGIIRASDFKLPPLVKCVDPDQYIATLNENGQLTLKFIIADFQTSLKNQEVVENFSFQNQNLITGLGPVSSFSETAFQFGEATSKNSTSWQSEAERGNGKLSSIIPKVSNILSTPSFKSVAQKNENGQNFNSSNIFSHNSPKKRQKQYNKGKILDHISSSNSSFLNNVQTKNESQFIFDLNEKSQKNDVFSTTFQKPETSGLPNSKSLWVDPIFNPILKVNYVIENIEPFQKGKPNQIVMIELWTNGSIHPRKAFYEALFYLKTMFQKLDAMKFVNSQFTQSILESEKTNTKFLHNFEQNIEIYNVFDKKNSFVATSFPEGSATPFTGGVKNFLKTQEVENEQKILLSLPIEKLQLPSRITKSLRQNNFQTIGDLLKINPQNVKKYPGIGNFSLLKIQKRLQQIGFE